MSGFCKTRQWVFFFCRGGKQLAGYKVQEDCGVAPRVQLHRHEVPHLFSKYGKGIYRKSGCI